jgi:uncharacterized membrane-anchored protein YhcB (DUF1043 family)
MLEMTPLVISTTVILSMIVGIVIGRIILKLSHEKRAKDSKEHEHCFHVDRATGIVSDISSFKC